MQNVLFDYIHSIDGKIGLIILNRPDALNALNKQMVSLIYNKLINWHDDKSICAVIIKSSSKKAFCAGGDLKSLYHAGKKNYLQEIDLFQQEYNLNKLIYYYKKPYIAILDGITMGAGLGISVHGRRVVATENLQMAMPETKIGLYPDIGATYFLSRIPNSIGMYLALTGYSININDAIYCNLVNYSIPSKDVELLLNQLQYQSIEDTLFKKENFQSFELKNNIKLIDECFSKDSVENIIEALKKKNDSFADKLVNDLYQRCPTSLKVTHKALTLGKNKSIDECLEMEFNLTISFSQLDDLYEGIRAVLIDKTRDPKWKPATLNEVKDSDIKELFTIKSHL